MGLSGLWSIIYEVAVESLHSLFSPSSIARASANLFLPCDR
jgi:hypothetical protein